jgi:1,4-alpha-glucan branching enzyme
MSRKKKPVPHNVTLLTDDDIFLFNEGSHFRLYEKLGAHHVEMGDVEGFYFAVWAPNAVEVSVIGDFNGWSNTSHHLRPKASSGIWEGFLPGMQKGDNYKYYIKSRFNNYHVEKADPFANYSETPPKTASIAWDLDYTWRDDTWMSRREESNNGSAPMAVYELHLGSWIRNGDRFLTYREIAPKLADYIKSNHFTHVEFLPVQEHPFYGSWGYQPLGFFAPTSRYGQPQDFMYLIDFLHEHEIGVILDWVPSHFPSDEHGLAFFDGTHLYEHADPRQRVHPEWDSYEFNYGRNEIRSFLISSAFFWLEKYHIDGLRVDAVASMLYLDYGRKDGEWIPNKFGGRENLNAVTLLKRLNKEVYGAFPGIQTIAEESTSWPSVSRPTYLGGLGFGMKWDMGWMHDTLDYFSKDPIHRSFHHNRLTFRMLYGFQENFVLPLSHDEVVYGKGSLIRKMPGDDWQKFANVRLLFGYMYAQPGKKLIFMGGEFGQWNEWYHDAELNWGLVEEPPHKGLQRWVRDLNAVYRNEPALHEIDFDPSGFEWIDCDDSQNSTLSLMRKGRNPEDTIVIACNFTPVPRYNFRLGVPRGGTWREILNSDGKVYGGSGLGNLGKSAAKSIPWHARPYSVAITLPPLAALYLKWEKA